MPSSPRSVAQIKSAVGCCRSVGSPRESWPIALTPVSSLMAGCVFLGRRLWGLTGGTGAGFGCVLTAGAACWPAVMRRRARAFALRAAPEIALVDDGPCENSPSAATAATTQHFWQATSSCKSSALVSPRVRSPGVGFSQRRSLSRDLSKKDLGLCPARLNPCNQCRKINVDLNLWG